MAKKLSLVLAAVAMLAFAVPAFASATTGLTEEGKLIAVGTEVLGTNNGSIVTTSTKTGNITCKKVIVHGKVEVNSAAEVKAGNAAGSTATECSVPSGATVTVPVITLTELKTTGEVVSGSTKKGIGKISFEVKIGTLACNYTTSTGEATYTAGGSELVITEQPLSVTPAACGTTAKLDGKFKLSTTGGTALVLD